MALLLKTRESAASLGPAIKNAVEALGTQRPVHDIKAMREYVDRSIGDTRFTMLVLAGFAGAALLLAAVGLYGTLAYFISQRTQELGIRIALGASAERGVRMVVSEGVWLTAVGVVIGLGAAAAMGGALRGHEDSDFQTRLQFELGPGARRSGRSGAPQPHPRGPRSAGVATEHVRVHGKLQPRGLSRQPHPRHPNLENKIEERPAKELAGADR